MSGNSQFINLIAIYGNHSHAVIVKREPTTSSYIECCVF